jgi:predicted lipoprotein with Yx(FWY)xxD motif
MKKLLIPLAAIVAAVALAACGGGSSDDDSASAAAAGTNGQTVAVQDLGDAGSVLVDSSGKALYTSNVEESGMVACTDGCESFWEPLTTDSGKPTGDVPGKLGVIDRPDGGGQQVTFNGVPLYSFTEDGTGEVTGDGFSDAFDGRQFTWSVVSVASGGGSQDTSPDTSSDSGDSSGSDGSLGY